MPKTSTSSEIEPIERLEKKIKLLITVLEQTRTEQAKTIDDNLRLSRDLKVAKVKFSETESVTAEVVALKAEREQIRTRVSDMLDQLEALSL